MDNQTETQTSESESQVLIFQTPQEDESQILIINPPMTDDQELIVYQNPNTLAIDSYCVVYKNDHFIINNPPNYQNLTKRTYINACLRQLYLVHRLFKYAPALTVLSRQEIYDQVDKCMRPERISARVETLKRVKRQLFRESRRKRKTTPTRGQMWGTQVFFFRPMRQKIGLKQMRRGYMRPARDVVLQQIMVENRQRERRKEPTFCQIVMNAAEGIFNVNAGVIGEICTYHKNGARHQSAIASRLSEEDLKLRKAEACRLTQRAKRLEAMFLHEQVRRALQNHQVILEESVRSIYYAKQLFHLVEDHEEFVFTDGQILKRSCIR